MGHGLSKDTPHGYIEHELKYNRLYKILADAAPDCCTLFSTVFALQVYVQKQLMEKYWFNGGFGKGTNSDDFLWSPWRRLHQYKAGNDPETLSSNSRKFLMQWSEACDRCGPNRSKWDKQKEIIKTIVQLIPNILDDIKTIDKIDWTVNVSLTALTIIQIVSIAEDFFTGPAGIANDAFTVVPCETAKIEIRREVAIKATKATLNVTKKYAEKCYKIAN